MSLRSDISAVLSDRLPDYLVMPYLRELDNSTKPVVMTHRKQLTQTERHAQLDHELPVHVLVPESFGEEAEDAADEALEAVLRVLQLIEDMDWTQAERANYSNFIGWEITLTASTKNYLLPEKEQ